MAVRHVRAFAAFIGRSPDTATAEELRLFQLHQTRSGMQPPSINGAVSALTGITVYLLNGGLLEYAQQMAAHESARTTKLYDRRNDQVTLDQVERIVL